MNSNERSGTSQESTAYVSSTSGDSRGRTVARTSLGRAKSRDVPRKIKRGYHTFMALGREFCVEKRWKLVRELGQGAYGLVVSVQDEITGETIAIKLITRVFDKLQLAKRALREITLLRHFNNHDNITGLIDMDVVGPDFNEIYLFMEPMEADLYQIIRSGQVLTDAHVRYFTYQILRGVKFIHSADVIHRDLKPGNLLVNSDCELKICDLGLSRGYDSRANDDNPSGLTEYVATRWYRAPEIMLSFKRYDTSIDMWSIGCILGELLGGKPVFKGKDYVEQLNLILKVLGTPPTETIKRIGSDKAQAYIRSLPFKKPIPFANLYPNADPQAVDLLSKLLTFDPAHRINVLQALEHPFLASYHQVDDEPSNLEKFEKWREVEECETTDQFRLALLREVEEFRKEVRSIGDETGTEVSEDVVEDIASNGGGATQQSTQTSKIPIPFPKSLEDATAVLSPPTVRESSRPVDPYRTYARRTSLLFSPDRREEPLASPAVPSGYPGEDPPASYIVPARSRASSVAGDAPAQFLRQLSTMSIGSLGNTGNLAVVNEGRTDAAADAPASTLPTEWARD